MQRLQNYNNIFMTYQYEMHGEEIYRQSFRIIRSEADLARFTPLEERVACRMIHAAGMVELAQHICFSPDFAQAAEAALQQETRDARVDFKSERNFYTLKFLRNQLAHGVRAKVEDFAVIEKVGRSTGLLK